MIIPRDSDRPWEIEIIIARDSDLMQVTSLADRCITGASNGGHTVLDNRSIKSGFRGLYDRNVGS